MGKKKKWKKKLLTNWRSIPAMILASDVAPRFGSRESFVRDVRFASASISIRSMILLAAAQCMLPRGTRNARTARACVRSGDWSMVICRRAFFIAARQRMKGS